MKRLKFLGVLAIALTIGLAGCGKGGQSEDKVPECAKHEWGEKVTLKEATCTEAGQSQRTCKVCGAKEEPKTIKALGHDFQDLGESAPGYVAPDFGSEGVMPQKCSRCDATQTRTIAALSREFAISSASLVKKEDGKVYLRLSGTCQYYTVDNFKWAWALQDYNNGQEGGAYLVGKAEPAAEDFNIAVELTVGTGGAGDTFTVDFSLSDIVAPAEVDKPGRYTLTAGPADNYVNLNVDLNPGNYADSTYRYYFRNDNEVGSRLAVCIEELPPFFHFTDAVPSFLDGDTVDSPKVAWVRIYGEALDQTQTKAELEEALAATHTACRFQDRNNGMTTRNEEGQFDIKVTEEEGKLIVSVWVNIQFMIDADNEVYNTHLNLKAGATINAWRDYTNCVMEGDFEHVLDISETRELVVFSHPLGANDVENSYGNLGFRTRAKTA